MTTAKNTVISPDFLVWKFCVKAQFQLRFTRYFTETVSLHKISTPGNSVKLRLFFAVVLKALIWIIKHFLNLRNTAAA